MKIFERFFISNENILLFSILHLSNNVFFLINFHARLRFKSNFSKIFTLWAALSATTQQVGRVRDAHFQRYQGLVVVYYDCAPECLVYEHLANVKFSG